MGQNFHTHNFLSLLDNRYLTTYGYILPNDADRIITYICDLHTLNVPTGEYYQDFMENLWLIIQYKSIYMENLNEFFSERLQILKLQDKIMGMNPKFYLWLLILPFLLFSIFSFKFLTLTVSINLTIISFFFYFFNILICYLHYLKYRHAMRIIDSASSDYIADLNNLKLQYKKFIKFYYKVYDFDIILSDVIIE